MNNLKDELRLKTKAYNTLNTTMKQLRADRDKDMVATDEATKADLMKVHQGRVAESYQIGFHDREELTLKIGTLKGQMLMTQQLKLIMFYPFLEVERKDAEGEDQTDLEGDQVFLVNYICELVENLLYEVGCRLIDQITDQVINEDDDDAS